MFVRAWKCWKCAVWITKVEIESNNTSQFWNEQLHREFACVDKLEVGCLRKGSPLPLSLLPLSQPPTPESISWGLSSLPKVRVNATSLEMQIPSSFQSENPLGILRGPTLVLTVLERFQRTAPECRVECQGNKGLLASWNAASKVSS